jgi:hypothetical protein
MKKIIGIISIVLILAGTTTAAWAGKKEPAKRILQSSSHVLTKTERTTLENRVKEIRDMKLNTLNSTEKQELKNELLGIKEKLSGGEPFTGIYLSAGAIIIILLILLIIT